MYFLFFMLLLALFSLIHASTFPYRDAKLLPMLMSGVILVMVIIELVKEFWAKVKALPGETKKEAEGRSGAELLRLAILLGWTGGFLIVTYVFGFMVATPVFILSFLKRQGRSWFIAGTFTVAVTAAIYTIFVIAVGLKLPEGIIFQ